MPFRRVPGRVKAFKEWANKEINNSELTESATPGRSRSPGKQVRQSRFRRRRRRRHKRKEDL